MTRPKLLSAVGGPNGLSIWTWLISLVFTVLITGIVEPLEQSTVNLQWLAAVLTSQAILGLGIWIAIPAVLPKAGQPSRQIAAITVLVVLGAIRALTMQAGSVLSGYDDGFSLTDRLVFGIGYSVIFGILIALVVDGARTHIATVRHLRGAQAIVTNEIKNDEHKLDRLHEETVRDVQEQLLQALSQSDLKPQVIRAWARDIIRPLSHELGAMANRQEEGGPHVDLPSPKIPLRERASLIGETMRPPSAIALVAIAESLAFLVLFQYESPLIALAHVIIGSVFILLTMWLFSTLYRPTRQYLSNAVSIAAGLTAVAALSVLGTGALVRLLLPAANSYPLYIVSIVFVGLALSIHRAVREIQHETEANLTETVSQLIEHRQIIETAIRSAQASASRFLHDSIQGILYAGALSGAQPADLHEDVTRAFRDFTKPVARPIPADQRARLDRLIGTWEHAFPVEVSFDDAAVARILQDSHLTDRLLGVLSEGLTNAAKHSLASGAKVGINQVRGEIVVTVSTPGCLGDRATAGLGSRSLSASATQWTLREDSQRTILTALIT